MPRREYLDRCQMIYYRNSSEKKEWIEAAKGAHIKISPFILEMARVGRARREVPREDPRELADLRTEFRKAKDHIETLELLRERTEAELLKLRQKDFLTPYAGERRREYSKRLLEVLREGGSWPGHELLQALHIPSEDSEAVDIVISQLHSLEGYGLVKETSKGWRWIG